MPSFEWYKKLISGKKWYHQGFDGSPMFLFAVGVAETKIEERKPKGTEANVRVCFFSNGRADWYLEMGDVNRGAKKVIDLAKKNQSISKNLTHKWKKDESAFEDLFWKVFPRIKLQKLSNEGILELWERYTKLFTNRFTSSSIIDHFALGTDEIIAEMIRKELRPHSQPLPTPGERSILRFTDIFSILTAPTRQSFINSAEIDLLKIILKKSKMSLSEYQKKYFWTKNNYVNVQVLNEKHFQQEIKAWKQSGKDLNKELRRIENTPKLNKQKKDKLFKKYKFSRLLRALLQISDDFTWWQDERKKSTYLNIHMGCEILKEVAKRTGYRLEELKYAIAPEVPTIISQHHPARRDLQERIISSVFIMTRKGYLVETGKRADDIRLKMFGKKSFDEIQDVRGLTASSGKAIGKVKILRSATEIGKVQKGDILVAIMTRPDYVPAMKRAAAIVTNEGGITSHAAIVSRELGIPCIIGTKIATEVFKDGDLVEVNANHGWVRKIK